jgi:hypothetical protein
VASVLLPSALTAMRRWKKVDEKMLHRKFLLLSSGKDLGVL